MIRRRLLAYTVMMTAGIISGFFVMEKTMLAGGGFLMLVTGSAVCLMVREVANDTCFSRGMTYENECHERWINETIRLTAALIAGFMLFSIRFIAYESESASLAGFGEETEICAEGIVTSIKSKETGFSIELKDAAICGFGGDDQGKNSEKVLRNKLLASYNGNTMNYSEYWSDADRAEDFDITELIGRKVKIWGRLRRPASADNPGCFNYKLYLRSCGIVYTLKADSVTYNRSEELQFRTRIAGKWKRFLFRIREKFLNYFEDETIRGFIKGVIFGDKSDIDEEIREDFNTNNTGHILAVSGVHIGFLYALLRFMAGKKKSLPVTLAIIMMVIIYGEMTLWSPSTVRAVTVLSISLSAVYVNRPSDLLTSLSGAAILILVSEPYQLFNTGFQMSFLALLGIAFLSGPLSSFLGESLSLMISVQLGVAPLTAYVFHRMNPLSIFINIPVIAIASVLVPLCIFLMYAGTITGYIPGFLIHIMEAVASFAIRINSIFAGDGSFSVQITAANSGILLFVYLLIFMTASEWTRVMILRQNYKKIVAALLCISVISFALYIVSYNTISDDEIVFVSVGQGDCTQIRSEGHDLLIDGGGSGDYNIGEKVLMPYLLANGADHIDMGIVTHLHMDHYKGIYELAKVYPVGRIGIPADYKYGIETSRKEDNIEDSSKDGNEIDPYDQTNITLPDESHILYLEYGTRIGISKDVYVEPIWPVSGNIELTIDDPNENNMVYMVHYGSVKIMVTGDLLQEDELEMVNYYKRTNILKCDILKVAHHGSKSSSSEAFLDMADPSIAVISVGRNNLYGHPHQQTLDRLEARGIEVYRTDLNGAIGIDIRKEKIIVDTMN